MNTGNPIVCASDPQEPAANLLLAKAIGAPLHGRGGRRKHHFGKAT